MQYRSNGTYLHQIGCTHSPTIPGSLQGAEGPAIDKNGNLWVGGNGYTPSEFALTSASGGDAACPGTYGTYIKSYGQAFGYGPQGLGGFYYGGGVKVDNYGNIWIADNGSQRLEMLFSGTNPARPGVAPTFKFVGQVGCDGTDTCTSSSTGCTAAGTCPAGWSADGQISPGADYAFDQNNNLWVADPTNNRLEEFTINYNNVKGGSTATCPSGATGPHCNMGTWVQTIGGGDGCAGGYASATSCNTTNGNTACCAANASSCTCAASNGLGNFNAPHGIAIDPDGTSVWVADFQNFRIEKFTINGASSMFAQEIGGMGASCSSAYGCSVSGTSCATTTAGICTSNSGCYCKSGGGNGQLYRHPLTSHSARGAISG